jgi:outer membrane murein-binding lipoprotein Lpp
MALDCPNCPNQGWYAVPNIHTGEPEQVQCEFCETDENSKFYLANKATSHPTPVQGEALPVVATVCCDIEGWEIPILTDEGRSMRETGKLFDMKLTDHAQATAEIARLQGEVDALKDKLTKQNVILGMTKLSVADKDRAIDQLRTQLSDTTGQVGKLREALHSIRNDYLAARDGLRASEILSDIEIDPPPLHKKLEREQNISMINGRLGQIDAALNSTALDTPHTQG